MPVAMNGTPTRPAAGSEIVFRPGDRIDPRGEVPPYLNSPVLRFVRVYTDDVFSMLGAHAMSWRAGHLDELKLRFDTLEHAWLADSALKSTVLGAKLTFADPDGKPYDMSSYTGNEQDVARSISLLPGVVRVRRSVHTAVAYTDSTATRVKLEQLTDPHWGTVEGLWAGHCYGKSCPVDPPPPNGEWPATGRRK